MSRRTIIFVNDEIYFRCRERIFSEETWADSWRIVHRETDLSDSLLSIMQEGYDSFDGPSPYSAWETLSYLLTALESFQKRQLKYDSDAINAVASTLQRVALRLKTHLLEGLPTVALDLVLLFVAFHVENERLSIQVRRRKGFPSWSWAGWVGMLSWADFGGISYAWINCWLDTKTWISWYKFQHGRFVPAIWDSEDKSPFPRTKEDIIYTRRTQPDLRKRFGNLDTARTKPSNCFLIKPYPLLIFFTVSVVLRIRSQLPRIITDLLSLENHTVSLHDKTNTFCGLLTFDVPSSPEDNRSMELIVLSELPDSKYRREKIRASILPRAADGIADVWTRKERMEDLSQPLELYSVMLIENVGDVYERRGLGEMLQTSVEKSLQPGPQWKEIILG